MSPPTHTHTPAPCLCPGSSAVPELQCCFILSSASEQNRKCSRSHPLHGEECPGCGHLSAFLCPPVSHMLLLLPAWSLLCLSTSSVSSPQRSQLFITTTELGQLLLILVEKGAEPEAILSLVVSGNSEKGFLGAPSHCRENPACCFEGSSTASHPRPTDRSPWRAA